MNAKTKHPERAFTFVELVVVIGVIAFCALMVLPALARTRTNSAMSQCQNNLKQLAAAWTMYSADNKGWLVSAYPIYGTFTASWCGGNAQTGGASAPYYDNGGADPKGITNGLIWPYVKTLSLYKCPTDKRVADNASVPFSFRGKPILRSVSMNSYMAGMAYPAGYRITDPSSLQNPNSPVFLKESEISRPSSIFVIVDEDQASINDAMLIVDMGGTRGFLDLPSRSHNNGYGVNFADGHTEYIKLIEPSSLSWVPGATVINNDWRRLTNMTTAPLN